MEALGQQGKLRGHVINRIHDGIGAYSVKQGPHVFVVHPQTLGGHGTSRSDVTQALGGRIGLGLAEGGQRGEGLSIEIGRLKNITVHKPQIPYPTAGERLCARPADGPKPHHKNPRNAEPRHRLGPQQRLRTQQRLTHKSGSRKSCREASSCARGPRSNHNASISRAKHARSSTNPGSPSARRTANRCKPNA